MLILTSFYEGLNHNCFGLGKNSLARIIAEVSNRQVNHKIFSIKFFIELSDDLTGFYAIPKGWSEVYPHLISDMLPLARYYTHRRSICSTGMNCCSDRNLSEIIWKIRSRVAAIPFTLVRLTVGDYKAFGHCHRLELYAASVVFRFPNPGGPSAPSYQDEGVG